MDHGNPPNTQGHRELGSRTSWFPFARLYGYYDPVMAGSIDATDTLPHDRAIIRALKATYSPKLNSQLRSTSESTIFVGRLPHEVNPVSLQLALCELLHSTHGHHRQRRHSPKDGKSLCSTSPHRSSTRSRSPFSSTHRESSEQDSKWPKLRIVRNLVTGYACGYAFAHFKTTQDADRVIRNWRQKHHNSCQGRICGLDIPNGNEVILEPSHAGSLPGWKPRRLGGGFGGRKESGQLRFGGVARPFRKPFSAFAYHTSST